MASDISGSNSRGISSRPTSMRATRSWARTPQSRKAPPGREVAGVVPLPPVAHRRVPLLTGHFRQDDEPFLLAVVAPVGGVFGEPGNRKFVCLHEPGRGFRVPGDPIRLVA